MILLDTSVWIEILKPKPEKSKNPIQLKSDFFDDVCICGPIIQEILQGVKDDLVYQKMKERLSALVILDENIPIQRYIEAGKIYRSARKKGYSIRSSQDGLIAAIAIHHNVPLLHFDRDYDTIQKFTDLKIGAKNLLGLK